MINRQNEFWIYIMARDLPGFPQEVKELVQGAAVVAGVVDEKGELNVEIPPHNISLQDYWNLVILVQNKDFSREIVDTFLVDREARERFIHQVRNYLSDSSLLGINLDLEMVSAVNRKNLNSLLQDLRRELDSDNYILSISVPAKTRDNPENNWNGAFDYQELGRICNYVMIMTYDFHWAGGPPGFIAPILWVRDVIDFAILQIPPKKILLGLPAYGYDWPADNRQDARGLTYLQAVRLAEKYGVTPKWDPEEKENYFTYRGEDGLHHVYFHDHNSIEARRKLASDYQLGGVILWRWNIEDPQIWKNLKDRRKKSRE